MYLFCMERLSTYVIFEYDVSTKINFQTTIIIIILLVIMNT